MSANAESRGHADALNEAEWSKVSDIEKTAIHAAIRAFAMSPGNSEALAMLRAVRAYQATMGRKL